MDTFNPKNMLVSLALSAVFVAPASATVFGHNSQAAFDAAIGNAPTYDPTLGVLSQNPGSVESILFSGNQPATTTMGDVTMSLLQIGGGSINIWNFGRDEDIPGRPITIGQWPLFGEGFNLDFARPLLAFSMSLTQPSHIDHTATSLGCLATCETSGFSVTALFQGTPLGSVAITAPGEGQNVFGITSGTPFDRLEIREDIPAAENEVFGNFRAVIAPVPAPPLAGIVLIGLAGLAAYRKAAAR